MTNSITITDTGKRRTSSGAAEETDLANNGNPVTLFGVEVTYNHGAIINDSPTVGKLDGGSGTAKFVFGEVDHIGVNQPKWVLQGVLRDDNATDRLTVGMIVDLVRTKGYKTLAGDLPDLVDGADDSSTVNVQVGDLKMLHRSSSNIIEYTLTMLETS